jgi:hypothetical protein
MGACGRLVAGASEDEIECQLAEAERACFLPFLSPFDSFLFAVRSNFSGE